MILLILFAFLAGIVTILSPCILPVLPIVLSSSLIGGKKRPLGIVIGFVSSFTFFTLFLATIVRATNAPPDLLRTIAIITIGIFGLGLIFPAFQVVLEKIFSKITSHLPQATTGDGFLSGIIMGLTLGLLWTPCVGPILASVITLAIAGNVTTTTLAITFFYALGTALPMLAIIYGGRNFLTRWGLINKTKNIQKIFGVIMVVTAIGLFFNVDRNIQTYLLTKFPNYGVGLTAIEDNPWVKPYLATLKNQPASDTRGKPMFDVLQENLGKAPDFIGGQEWFNTKPLTLSALQGKVILVDFWTYTCINCIRTLPYVKSWWEKYKDKGLVIVGVHTPEFAFEKEAANVQKAITDFGITYPVVQDNNYTIWNAYSNQYWPAEYLIDKSGKIRHTHFGEGDYDESEKAIAQLLNESGANIDESKIKNPAYQVRAQTPETYVGYARSAYLSSPERIIPDKPMQFSAPIPVPYNTYALTGTWTINAEYAKPGVNATLTFHVDAGDVYLVMRPNETSNTGDIEILVDGNKMDVTNAGDDVLNGQVKVTSDRLYKIAKFATPGEHIIQLKFLDSNLELYAFTFG